MKSEPDRGSSSPHQELDDTGLSAIDSDCQPYLTTTLSYTDLTHDIDKQNTDNSFIGSERYRYRSQSQITSPSSNGYIRFNLAIRAHRINHWRSNRVGRHM